MYFYEEYYNSYAHLMWSLFSIDNNPTYIEQQLFFSQIKCLICRQESKLRKMKTYYEKHSNTWGANSTMGRKKFQISSARMISSFHIFKTIDISYQ